MYPTLNFSIERERLAGPGFGNVLVVGAGATAGTLVPMVTDLSDRIVQVDLAPYGVQAYQELRESGGKITATGKIDKVGWLDSFVLGYSNLADCRPRPDTIFLSIPNSAYLDAVVELGNNGVLEPGQLLVGISTRLGSGDEIRLALRRLGLDGEDFSIVSFSTYWAGTKPLVNERGEVVRRTTTLTRASKASIHVGVSGDHDGTARAAIDRMLGRIGTRAKFVAGTLGAEAHNANTYAHAQITMWPEALDCIFRKNDNMRFLYRPYPEGCLTEGAALQMATADREITDVFQRLGFPPPNFLEMLEVELYPTVTVSQQDVVDYPRAEEQVRAKSLYAWFFGRQTDPETGEEHLRKVGLQRVTEDENGCLVIPRIPGEDYISIRLIKELGDRLGAPTSTLSEMIELFEGHVAGAQQRVSLDLADIRRQVEELAQVILERCVPVRA